MERRLLDALEAQEFRAVGRLNLGSGRRFCTAALVSPRIIVTAAHCLYDPRTGGRAPLANLRFVAGYRIGEYAALRRVVGAAEAAGFALRRVLAVEDLAADVAFLALDRPVGGVAPLAIGTAQDAPATIVSYARDRPEAASIAAPCARIAAAPRVLTFDCGAELGASGAPVLQGEGAARRLVAVVSARGALDAGGSVTLAAEVAPALKAAAALGSAADGLE